MKKLLLFLTLVFSIQLFAQTDSSKLQISVLTCSPGNELYSIFGHTALRIIDSTNGSDIVYNYGTFDFEDPNFLMKFTRGKLDYFLSQEYSSQFFASYQYEGRTITEQVLNLSSVQKNNIHQALIKNLSGNNKFYKYDFLFDNCTTRIRDILKTNASFSCNTSLIKSTTTFRNMLYQYLDSGGMSWSKLGIDFLLGSKIDRVVTIEESTFLPDYLMFAIDSFNINHQFISSRKIYPATSLITSSKNNQPLIFSSLLLLIVLLLYFIYHPKAQKIFKIISFSLVLLTGILGCVLLFMWFGTDHKSCAHNYNLLWALPTNIVGFYLIVKKSKHCNTYFHLATLLTFILLCLWFVLPQQFNIAFLPFTLAMGFCYNSITRKN
jgi:hypothetical protein